MRAIVLLSHGSRDPIWRQSADRVAERMQQRQPGVTVRCAFLELCDPDLANVVQELVALGATEIAVLPLFLGMGRHTRADLPVLVEQQRQTHPQLKLVCMPAIGENAAVIDLLATLALS